MAASTIADPALAPAGDAAIAWAEGRMPALRSVRERFAAASALAGVRVGACLHVTSETAALLRALVAAGAEVDLCAANPLSTQDAAAAALAQQDGITVRAVRGESRDDLAGHLAAVAATAPHVTLDDGAGLIMALHAAGAAALGELKGGTEETATGVVRLRALDAAGGLHRPVIALTEARAAELFDARYGTGQSTIDGILRATNILLAGATFVVLGFGRCGRGIAARARGAGARVIVCEVDPVAALEAAMEGYEVAPAAAAAPAGDVFVTATGGRDVLRREHFEAMKDGAIVANAGHFDVEVSVPDLAELAVERRAVRPLVERFVRADGAGIDLLASGRVVNLAAGEGNPAAVMDIAFATQALAVQRLVADAGGLPPGVHPVPGDLDAEVAALGLGALGVAIDALTPEQHAYLHAWEPGR
ncbi:MAG: adenosylhomocysteinase [Solirubrobacteraceae bacterium]